MFVQTFDWLAEIGSRAPPDEYELVVASGRLRLLLLDARRLVDQVNASRRLDIRYRILRHGDGPPLQHLLRFWAVPDGLSPALAPPGHNIPIEDVKLATFLRERVIIYEGEHVSVRDLIDHVANVAGGVHAGKPRDPRDLKLEALAEEIVVHGMSVAIRCLRGIVIVVVDALRPLRAAVGPDNRLK